jgi:hypothetical protein
VYNGDRVQRVTALMSEIAFHSEYKWGIDPKVDFND